MELVKYAYCFVLFDESTCQPWAGDQIADEALVNDGYVFYFPTFVLLKQKTHILYCDI